MLELLSQVQVLADQAVAGAAEYSGLLDIIKTYIVDHFGQTGLVAAGIALAVLLLFVVSRLAKLAFSAAKYLVIPALALAFLASLVLPLSFTTALPASVTICSLWLLFKS